MCNPANEELSHRKTVLRCVTVHGNVGEGWADMAKCDVTDGSGVRQGIACQKWGLWVVSPGRAWPPFPHLISFPALGTQPGLAQMGEGFGHRAGKQQRVN